MLYALRVFRRLALLALCGVWATIAYLLFSSDEVSAIQNLYPASAEFSSSTPVNATSSAVPRLLTAESAQLFLDNFFADEKIAPLTQGAVVSIVKDGRVLIERGYGFTDTAHSAAVSPDTTLFRVASLSKTFIAIAIMQLVEQQLLDLHTDITRYLPTLELDNPFDEPVTIAHLLTHTSGFDVRDPLTSELHHDFDRTLRIEDYVRDHMPQVIRKPGQAYMYDNFAYALLGLLIERTSNLSFEQYMQRYVFHPLGMMQSTFVLNRSTLTALVDSYASDGSIIEPYALTPSIMPQGGLLTTASDMSRFMLSFLNDGALGHQRILSPESVAIMSAYRVYAHPNLPNTTYGFEASFQLPAAGSSNRILAKSGDLVGFSSYMWLIPDANVGVFISYNNNSSLRQYLYAAFLRTFYPALTKPVIDLRKQPAIGDLSVYNGLYRDLRLSTLVHAVQAEGNHRLTLTNARSGSQTLQLAGQDLFLDESGLLVAFIRDDRGEIRYLKEASVNPLGYAERYRVAKGFADLASDHEQAQPILALQSFGLYDNDPSLRFEPNQVETRAIFIDRLLQILHLPVIPSPDATGGFVDTINHPFAASIASAAAYGLIVGNDGGFFEPDRAITRQEVAVILHRYCSTQRMTNVSSNINIIDPLDPWALPGVQMMIALGLGDTQLALTQDGYLYRGKQSLIKAEAAALYYRLLTERLFDRLPLLDK